jgi:hypothetical protein
MNKTLIFSKTLQQLKALSNETDPKAPKKNTAASQSRDIREDRGERQIKTTKNSQTFPHVR